MKANKARLSAGLRQHSFTVGRRSMLDWILKHFLISPSPEDSNPVKEESWDSGMPNLHMRTIPEARTLVDAEDRADLRQHLEVCLEKAGHFRCLLFVQTEPMSFSRHHDEPGLHLGLLKLV